MPVLTALDPTPEQIKDFLGQSAAHAPVYMLNLLKFKEKATYKDNEDISGRDAYKRYISAFSDLVKNEKDVETIFSGNANTFLIGQGQGDWDAVTLVKYPNAARMFDLVSSDAYRKIHHHRRAGLKGQLLISCEKNDFPF